MRSCRSTSLYKLRSCADLLKGTGSNILILPFVFSAGAFQLSGMRILMVNSTKLGGNAREYSVVISITYANKPTDTKSGLGIHSFTGSSFCGIVGK